MNKEYEEILNHVLDKLANPKKEVGLTMGRYLSWWIRIDLDDKYSSKKINYELKKAVEQGILVSKSEKHGVEYSLPTTKTT